MEALEKATRKKGAYQSLVQKTAKKDIFPSVFSKNAASEKLNNKS